MRWAILLGVVVAVPGLAQAYHGPDTPRIEGTADTLADGEWQVGLWRAEYGVRNDLLLGLHTVPLLMGLLPALPAVPNLFLKYQFLALDSWRFAADWGLYVLDFRKINPDVPATLGVFPMGLTMSTPLDSQTTGSLKLVYTAVRVDGTAPKSDSMQGAAASANAQWVGQLDRRVSETLAVVIDVRVLLHQEVSANMHVASTTSADRFVTTEVHMEGESDIADFDRAWAISPSLVWSWETLNVRAGLGYGNAVIPGLNFWFPTKAPLPYLDVFARF